MGNYSISDLAELTGIKTHTLRVWEKRYGLLSPQRNESNIRLYCEHDLDTLLQVKKLNEQGVKISRIAGMSLDQMKEECRLIALLTHDDQDKLQAALLRLDVTTLENVLDGSVRKRGFDATLMKLIIPFLEKMERLWLAGDIEEAHEVCFKELVKRKTSREIDSMPHNCSGPRIIMFLPAGNHQQLSHLFLHYFLRQQGMCVTDMGCDINLDCASSALKKCTTDCVIVVNADPVHWQFGSFIRELAHRTSVPIVVSGRAAGEEWNQENEHVIVMDTVEDTIRFVSRLQENIRSHMS